MAEINDVNMRQNRWRYLWQLTLALAGVALLIWAVIEMFKPDTDTAREAASKSAPQQVIAVPAKVSEFTSFVRDNSAQEMMKLEHDYTSEGILRLADALGAIADQRNIAEADITDRLDHLRAYANRLQQNAHSTEHADIVREAFTLASELMASIERQIPFDLKGGVANVRQAAEAIDPDELLLYQKADVDVFFKDTSRLLNEMVAQRAEA